MRDAEPGDIYADKNGKLWRIMGMWREPVIIAEEIEPEGTERQKMTAGISGLLWEGFQHIFRPDKTHKKRPVDLPNLISSVDKNRVW